MICQTYPLVEENFAANDNLFGPDLKLISEFDTYKLIKKFSKKALGPGDFPKRILSEFAAELALPYRDITNCALKFGIFQMHTKSPRLYPSQKQTHPENSKI